MKIKDLVICLSSLTFLANNNKFKENGRILTLFISQQYITTGLKCSWFKEKVPSVWEHLNESIQVS